MTAFLQRVQSAAELTDQQMVETTSQIRQIPPILILAITLAQSLIAGLTINAVAAFGEELGWRGLLQKELEKLNFWKASLLIGFIWGLWHAPIIVQGHNYPDHPIAGIGMMILWCMSMAPIIGFIRLKAQSVIAAAIFHGTINATYGLSIMYISGGNDLLVGFTGAAGIIAFTLFSIALYYYSRPFFSQ